MCNICKLTLTVSRARLSLCNLPKLPEWPWELSTCALTMRCVVWTTLGPHSASARIDNMAVVQELQELICKAEVSIALVLVLAHHLLLLLRTLAVFVYAVTLNRTIFGCGLNLILSFFLGYVFLLCGCRATTRTQYRHTSASKSQHQYRQSQHRHTSASSSCRMR